MPIVSVIIPTFDRADFVKEAVDSVLAQSFSDFELLVVDDGSTDHTVRTIEPYGNALRYVEIPHGGVSAARNVGARMTSGEWIAFLDSDDLWLPRKLERQLDALERAPEFPLCYTDEIWIRKGRRVNQKNRHRKYSGRIFERCLPLCIISPSSALMKRRLFEEVGGFDENLPACEDYDLWLRITIRHPVLFLEEKLIVKRGGHADQLSTKHWGMDRFRVTALTKILRESDPDEMQKAAVLDELEKKCRILVQGAEKRGETDRALEYEQMIREERGR